MHKNNTVDSNRGKLCSGDVEVVEKAKSIRFNQADGFAQVWFCDEFPGPWENSYSAFLDVLSELRAADHDQEVHVYISSPGGYVSALNDMAAELRTFKHVVTVVNGLAASCGFLLMCLGDEIYVSPGACLIFHSPSTFFEGNTKSIDIESEYMKKLWKASNDAFHVERILNKEEIEEGYHSDVKFLGSELIERKAVMPYEFYARRTIPQNIKAYSVGDMIFVFSNGNYYAMNPVVNPNDDKDHVYISYKTLAKITNPEVSQFIDGQNEDGNKEAEQKKQRRKRRQAKKPEANSDQE